MAIQAEYCKSAAGVPSGVLTAMRLAAAASLCATILQQLLALVNKSLDALLQGSMYNGGK
jgi:hypothetical protein